MDFSVGILYSIQEFMKKIDNCSLHDINFIKTFKKYKLADSKAILDIALGCNWIGINIYSNQFVVTEEGQAIIKLGNPVSILRAQLLDIIEKYKHPWAASIIYGREEALKFLSLDIKQCFIEAEVCEGYDSDIVKFWDTLSAIIRGLDADAKIELGRIGEKLSLEYERNRLNHIPKWVAIDSNLLGYDILSFVDNSIEKQLKIEVKACYSTSANITFYISYNEWKISQDDENYRFHIWNLYPHPRLAIFTADAIKGHIPNNNGAGKWISTKIDLPSELFNTNIIYEKK